MIVLIVIEIIQIAIINLTIAALALRPAAEFISFGAIKLLECISLLFLLFVLLKFAEFSAGPDPLVVCAVFGHGACLTIRGRVVSIFFVLQHYVFVFRIEVLNLSTKFIFLLAVGRYFNKIKSVRGVI